VRITPEMAEALEKLDERGPLPMGTEISNEVGFKLVTERLAKVGPRLILTITELGREVIK
jgi:hypothetical protein